MFAFTSYALLLCKGLTICCTAVRLVKGDACQSYDQMHPGKYRVRQVFNLQKLVRQQIEHSLSLLAKWQRQPRNMLPGIFVDLYPVFRISVDTCLCIYIYTCCLDDALELVKHVASKCPSQDLMSPVPIPPITFHEI